MAGFDYVRQDWSGTGTVSIYPNLDGIGDEKEYAAFNDILPEGTTVWDIRDDILQKEEGNIMPQPAFAKNFEMLSDDIVSGPVSHMSLDQSAVLPYTMVYM